MRGPERVKPETPHAAAPGTPDVRWVSPPDPPADAGPSRPPTPSADAVEALPAVRVLACSRTTETAVVDLPGTGHVVRKRWSWPTARDRWRGALRTTFLARSPAERERAALERLRGLRPDPFAPRPLAVSEDRRSGVLLRCTLLLEEIPGAVDLATFLRDSRDAAARAAVLADLGRRTRAMHDAGLRDGEHHPRNVLVGGAPLRTWRIDCAKQRVRREPLRGDAAVADLAAIDVALVRCASDAERRGFVAAWLGGARAAPDGPAAPALDAAEPSVESAIDATLAHMDRLRAAFDARESRRLPPPRDHNGVTAG